MFGEGGAGNEGEARGGINIITYMYICKYTRLYVVYEKHFCDSPADKVHAVVLVVSVCACVCVCKCKPSAFIRWQERS